MGSKKFETRIWVRIPGTGCHKSRVKGDHKADLETIFDIMRAHQLKMNPTKSFLGVGIGKFLGFVVTSKGIHLDPEKVRAVQRMQPPRNLGELRGL